MLILLFNAPAPPIFLVQPMDQKVAEGAPAALDCIAAGNPTPTLFWMKETDPGGVLLPATNHGHLAVTPEGTLRIGKQQQMRLQSPVSQGRSYHKILESTQSLLNSVSTLFFQPP